MVFAWLACVTISTFAARYLRNTFFFKFAGKHFWFQVRIFKLYMSFKLTYVKIILILQI